MLKGVENKPRVVKNLVCLRSCVPLPWPLPTLLSKDNFQRTEP